MLPETARAGSRDDATTGPAWLAACRTSDAMGPEFGQEDLASRSASPEAFAAARDLAFESLIETGSLAESYSRSLTEAAWRGDQSTVGVHLRQLRACVVTAIGIFKHLDGVRAKGAGA